MIKLSFKDVFHKADSEHLSMVEMQTFLEGKGEALDPSMTSTVEMTQEKA